MRGSRDLAAESFSEGVVSEFRCILSNVPDLPVPLAAIKSIVYILAKSKSTTMTEFTLELETVSRVLLSSYHNSISLAAGCELFKRFVTRIGEELAHLNFDAFKAVLLEKGTDFADARRANEVRRKIVRQSYHFVKDDSVILVHSFSRVVISLLEKAQLEKKRFSVFVTEARPTKNGERAVKHLQSLKIPATLILDSAVGYFINKVDFVLTGAEGVVENGGIINQIGTYQMAIIAKSAGKPFYVAAESFKFVRIFPLSQYDLPSNFSIVVKQEPNDCSSDIENEMEDPNPFVDYTDPSYITLLFTDIGVLTPSGVSDELIKLYY